ncbi:Neogenin [Anabarilius grahami]|uniref:Neogenin n=1 Tax=Anabarilius grahami TaxID=495550 RepID=A0A3N0XIT6_ANAGA|nr:Neogenin [Anabarilius grahami]
MLLTSQILHIISFCVAQKSDVWTSDFAVAVPLGQLQPPSVTLKAVCVAALSCVVHLNGDPVWSRECPVSACPVYTPPVSVCEVSCCSWSVGTCGGQWGKCEGTGGANVCGGQMKSTDEWRGFFWLFARRWNIHCRSVTLWQQSPFLGVAWHTKANSLRISAEPVATEHTKRIHSVALNHAIDYSAHERFAVIGTGSLQIVNLTEEDAGIYVCQADSGNMTSEIQAELTVHVPPRFLTRPSNTYAQESMDIIFECDVTGSPPPTVKWMKDGDTVIPSDYFRIVKQHNLQVLGLVKSDEGFYQCLAENEARNVQASAQLIILALAPYRKLSLCAYGPFGPRQEVPHALGLTVVRFRSPPI